MRLRACRSATSELLSSRRALALPFGRSLQLTAGRVNVAPARSPHRSRDSCLEDDVAERPDPSVVRALVGGARPRVERDQIDLRWKLVLADQPDQLARVLVAVVLVLEHHIFERDPPRIVRARVSGARLEQL